MELFERMGTPLKFSGTDIFGGYNDRNKFLCQVFAMADNVPEMIRSLGMTKRKSIPAAKSAKPKVPFRRFSGTPLHSSPRLPNKAPQDAPEMALFAHLFEVYKGFRSALPENLIEKTKTIVKAIEVVCDRAARGTIRKMVACDEVWKSWASLEDVFLKWYQGVEGERKKDVLTELRAFRSLADVKLDGFLKAENKMEMISKCWEEIEEEKRGEMESAKEKLENAVAELEKVVQARTEFQTAFDEVAQKIDELFPRAAKPEEKKQVSAKKAKKSKLSSEEEEQLSMLKTENRGLATQLREFLATKRSLERQLRQLQKKSDEETENLQKMIRQMKPRKAAAEHAMGELEKLTKEVEELTQQKNTLMEEVAPLRETLKKLESEDVQKTRDAVEALTQANELLNQEISAITARVQMKEEIVTKLASFCSAADPGRESVMKYYGLQNRVYYLRRRIYALKHNTGDDKVLEQIMEEKDKMNSAITAEDQEFFAKRQELQALKTELMEKRLRLLELQQEEKLDSISEITNELTSELNQLRNDAASKVAPLQREPAPESQDEAELERQAAVEHQIMTICLAEAQQELQVFQRASDKLQTLENEIEQYNEAEAAARADLAYRQFEKQIVMRHLVNRDFDMKAAFQKRIEKTETELEKLSQVMVKATEQLRELNTRLGGSNSDDDTVKTLLKSISALSSNFGLKGKKQKVELSRR